MNLVDSLTLDLDGRRHWFLHGDAFDLAVGTGAALRWCGSLGYDTLVTLGTGFNAVRRWLGRDALSLADACKRRLPLARRHIARFEECCLRAAAARECDVVVTGHIHMPAQHEAVVQGRRITYLNSGDWVDSLSALEYAGGRWSLVRWHDLLTRGEVGRPHAEEPLAVDPAA